MGLDITGIGSVADLAKGAMDFIAGFFPAKMSDAEKAQATLGLQSMIQQRDAVRDQATVTIIQAEMAQGDNYTKRARPTVVYTGLAMIGLVHVLIPVIVYVAAVLGKTLPAGMPALTLPNEFWFAWTSVVGIWSIGRSAEKRGAAGKLVQGVTGSGPMAAIMDRLSGK